MEFASLIKSDLKDFEDYFTEDFFRECFNIKLRGKNGGGRDRLTPDSFINQYKDELKTIPVKCIEGRYKFTPYKERLNLKGRDKFPRVISIPSVRDRLVLSVLNCYLQSKLQNLVNSKPANQYIRQIQNFIIKNDSPITFYKTDFTGFYDSVDKDKLLDFLSGKYIHPKAFQLVRDSINTPTLSDYDSIDFFETNKYGIPQGLAISNILSALYLEEFDEFLKDKAQLYLRYVDDILLLNPLIENPTEVIERFIKDNRLNLRINLDKTKQGIVWNDELTFLGYNFKNNKTSLRKENVTMLLNRLAKECSVFKKQFENREQRPEYLKDDDTFVQVKIEQLNLSITGIKVNNRCFGWIHHYQQIDDLALLTQIDKILKCKLLDFIPEEKKKNLKSFKRCYFSIMEGKTNKVAFDIDSIDDIDKIKAFMTKKGWLQLSIPYTEDEIRRLFASIVRRLQKKMERHIGRIS